MAGIADAFGYGPGGKHDGWHREGASLSLTSPTPNRRPALIAAFLISLMATGGMLALLVLTIDNVTSEETPPAETSDAQWLLPLLFVAVVVLWGFALRWARSIVRAVPTATHVYANALAIQVAPSMPGDAPASGRGTRSPTCGSPPRDWGCSGARRSASPSPCVTAPSMASKSPGPTAAMR